MQELSERQKAIDSTVTEWPEARPKQAFGHHGYVRNGKMFGFIVDDGVAVKAWAGDEAERLYGLDGVHAFSHSGMEMRAWPILPLRDDTEAETALTALQNAYEKSVAT